MGQILSILWQVVKALPAILALIKQIFSFWHDMREKREDTSFKEGVKEGDSSKIEKGFGSDKAGEPVPGVGTIGELPDEKN